MNELPIAFDLAFRNGSLAGARTTSAITAYVNATNDSVVAKAKFSTLCAEIRNGLGAVGPQTARVGNDPMAVALGLYWIASQEWSPFFERSGRTCFLLREQKLLAAIGEDALGFLTNTLARTKGIVPTRTATVLDVVQRFLTFEPP